MRGRLSPRCTLDEGFRWATPSTAQAPASASGSRHPQHAGSARQVQDATDGAEKQNEEDHDDQAQHLEDDVGEADPPPRTPRFGGDGSISSLEVNPVVLR